VQEHGRGFLVEAGATGCRSAEVHDAHNLEGFASPPRTTPAAVALACGLPPAAARDRLWKRASSSDC